MGGTLSGTQGYPVQIAGAGNQPKSPFLIRDFRRYAVLR